MRVVTGIFWILVLALLGGCDGAADVADNDFKEEDRDAGEADSGVEADSDEVVADCEPADPDLAEADAAALFDYPKVPTFDIYLPKEAWADLQANAVDEVFTRAEACFEGRRIGTVGLRFKGSYGTLYGCFDETGEMICPRLSMKLKFDKYNEEHRFYGLKRLNFNANRYDDTRMKEKLAYDLYRAFDIVAPRSAWAVVRVNGQSYGLFGMVEEIDGRFTADRWPDHPDGNIYKEAWPTDTEAPFVVSSLRTNEDDPNVSGFLSFSEALTEADGDEEVLDVLGTFTDLDYWARYMAIDDAIASYDGVTYFYTDGTTSHNHNYNFYEHAPGRFTLIPWDVETTFWINPDHAAPHWTEIPEDCSIQYPYWGGYATAPACDPILRALNADLDRWRAAARELLEGPFALETMVENIDRHAAFIGDEARDEATPTMYATFDASVAGLKSAVQQLRARLEALIAEE